MVVDRFWASLFLPLVEELVTTVLLPLVSTSPFSKIVASAVASSENIILALSVNLLKEVKFFCILSGIIYPFKFISNVAFTILSSPSDNSLIVENELILALNLNLSGFPQYESEA